MGLSNITAVCVSPCTSLYKLRSDRSLENFCSFHLPPLSFPPLHPHSEIKEVELDWCYLSLYILLEIFFRRFRCSIPQNFMHLSNENQRAFGHILLRASLFNILVPERNILVCSIHNFFLF